MRRGSGARLLNLHLGLVFLFLYGPILVLVALSFNRAGLPTAWTGFSFRWYEALAGNASIHHAVANTLIVAASSTLIATALGTLLAVALASSLPLEPQHRELLIVPASFSTVLTGFLLLTTRIKAITQAIGYLVLENGVFVFGMLLVEAMPFLVEIGVLLDLFVGIFVVSIIIHHINREFASLDTRRLASLKE